MTNKFKKASAAGVTCEDFINGGMPAVHAPAVPVPQVPVAAIPQRKITTVLPEDAFDALKLKCLKDKTTVQKLVSNFLLNYIAEE